MINTFIKKQFEQFNIDDISPYSRINEALIIFISWALPAFALVLIANFYFPDSIFLQKAIEESIGPNLWNLMGSFAVISFGVALVFPKIRILSNMSKQLLLGTYNVGSLIFGILVGQFVLIVNADRISTWWKIGLFGITSAYLLLIVFLLNLMLWYLSFLIQTDKYCKTNFIKKFEVVHWSLQFIIGGAFICISLAVLRWI